jgi:DNA-directed RNA polymerase subunit beta'
LLNRAPTLHRLSIQAFQPTLVEGKAIQLHPLVCGAFNADFDGDQMAVHVPLSNASILEAQLLMLAPHNMLNPQDGSPVTLPSQDMVLGLYYLTKERVTEKTIKEPVFYSSEEVIISFNEGKISLHDPIKVKARAEDDNGEMVQKIVKTTVGRVIFNEAVPLSVPFVNELMTKKHLKQYIGEIIQRTNFAVTAKFLDDIKDMGFFWAFKAGLSFNLGDLITPSIKAKTLVDAQKEVDEVWDSYNMGLITNNERYNQIIDRWTYADNRITDNLMKELALHKGGFNSVYMMLHSGARGSKQQIKQLCGLRGLMAKPRKSGDTGGAIIENPILSNFQDGLSVLEYFISTHGARKGLADTALKTADAGYLTRRLVDVAQDVVITDEDCNTLRGIDTSALIDNDKVIENLSSRIQGRFTLNNVHHPITDEVIIAAGEYIDEKTANYIEKSGVEYVMIRSVLTCEARKGVCTKCYGKNMATGRITETGDAVGIIAAQSIGEPGTQLTLRTFHVGGVAAVSKAESEVTAKFDGIIEFDGVKFAESHEGGVKSHVVLSRSGEIKVLDPDNRKLLTSAHVPYGATLLIKDGQKVTKGEILCNWDPFNALIVSEFSGIVKFDSIEEGVTFRMERDDQTGYSEKIIIESKNKKKIPAIFIVSPSGEELKSYSLPVGAYISIEDNEEISAGQKIGKIPRNVSKVSDITGGLPRVTELFEARNPSNPAVVSEIDGIVIYGKIKRGNREIFVEDERTGQRRKYLIGLSKHILVQEGDFIRAGLPLSDGTIAPRDILQIKGLFAVQSYLVNGVQEVYRSQGININDKHIEVIVRQMMRWVQIEDPGDTTLLEGEPVDKWTFIAENDNIFDKKVITEAGDSVKLKRGQLVSIRQLREENSFLKRNDKKICEFRDAVSATSSSLLLGITRASLGTSSWISAASFQETTKVLSSAAIAAKSDDLSGLKENVIIGKKIPAGTGQKIYKDLLVNTGFRRKHSSEL